MAWQFRSVAIEKLCVMWQYKNYMAMVGGSTNHKELDELNENLKKLNKSNTNLSSKIYWLTWAVVALTTIMVIVSVVELSVS